MVAHGPRHKYSLTTDPIIAQTHLWMPDPSPTQTAPPGSHSLNADSNCWLRLKLRCPTTKILVTKITLMLQFPVLT